MKTTLLKKSNKRGRLTAFAMSAEKSLYIFSTGTIARIVVRVYVRRTLTLKTTNASRK